MAYRKNRNEKNYHMDTSWGHDELRAVFYPATVVLSSPLFTSTSQNGCSSLQKRILTLKSDDLAKIY